MNGVATYRLQFSPRFRFDDARAIVPYLADLGIGAIYASPYLKARPGSEHGYDVVDPNRLNDEIGSDADHAAFIASSQAAGLGHIVDFVPNHMGVGGSDNPWWQDVLEWGEASPFAHYFDIDWRPLRAQMRGKVLVPALGDYYGRALERGELEAIFDAPRGTFAIAYYEHRFPIATREYAEFLALAAERHDGEAWALRALAAEFGEADRERATALKAELARVASEAANRRAIEVALDDYRATSGQAALDRLDELLRRQHYRLAFWRVSADEVNYRRFFDINDLAGVRVEDAEVFGQIHRYIFESIASGAVTGLRIDHVDGLANPGGYCTLLRDRAEALGHDLYLVVEKILARGERLRDWPIAGTTGYEFMNAVAGLFIDRRAEAAFDRLYRRFAGIGTNFDQFAYRAKRDIMRTALASELSVLATMLDRIAAADRRSSDLTALVLQNALAEVIASFPVYRTYVTSETIDPDDARYIGEAIAAARRRSELGDDRVFDFIAAVLTAQLASEPAAYDRREIIAFAMKFQQYTSPVMAKAVEDTAFYRYVRLVALNEVGGDPRAFGTSVADFHRANGDRARNHPQAMLATATHDHKRGEDTRLRIAALSEMPERFERTIRRLHRRTTRFRTTVDGATAPTENDQYFLTQAIVGTWPPEWLTAEGFGAATRSERDEYTARIVAYAVKAIREAKFKTSWTNPNVAYEAATEAYVRGLLETANCLDEVRPLAAECATIGAFASLAQVTLKITSPGVPDFYQGTELWDLSLVDPDNRRPVDYGVRARVLAEIEARTTAGATNAYARELLAMWPDGRIKAFVTRTLLRFRRERLATFSGGAYTALRSEGAQGGHLVAFARDDIVVIVPRLFARFLTRAEDEPPTLRFSDARVVLPSAMGTAYVDRLTGNTHVAERTARRLTLDAAAILANFPVAVLERAIGDHVPREPFGKP